MIYAFIDPHTQDLLFQNYEPVETDWYFEVPDDTTPNDVYIDGEGLQFYPPKPADWAEWDHLHKVWFDPRDPAEVLQNLRNQTTVSRVDFLMGCVSQGVLQQSDALVGAKGDIPPSMVDAIASLPDDQAFEIQLRWAALTQVDRLDPLIATLAAVLSIDDTTLDRIFGITDI